MGWSVADPGWLTGQPAITIHNYGTGTVYHVGAYLGDAAQDALFAIILREAGLQPGLETPVGVEACLWVGAKGGEVFILINHGTPYKRYHSPGKRAII